MSDTTTQSTYGIPSEHEISESIAAYNDPMNRGIVDGWKSVSARQYQVLKHLGWETKSSERHQFYFARPMVEVPVSMADVYKQVLEQNPSAHRYPKSKKERTIYWSGRS